MSDKTEAASGEAPEVSLLRDILQELRGLRDDFAEHKHCDHGPDCEPSSTINWIHAKLENEDGSNKLDSILEAIYNNE